MSETKGIVRCVIGFFAIVAIIVGSIFGLDVKVDINDTETTEALVETEAPMENEVKAEEPTDATVPVVDENDTPAESTPTEDANESVDETVEENVANDTADTTEQATEGEMENA